MKRKLFLILSLFLGLMAQAQNNISVASFRLLPNDMTANTQGTMRTDQNGHTAALIKVVTTQTGFTFDVGMMGIVDTKQEPGEIWVYVPFGVKHITIRHPQLGVLRDYYFPITIEEARTYEMVLASGTVSTIVESDVGGSYLMMTVEPKTAMVYIDEQLKAIENGEVMLLLPYGKHTYRVEAPSYMNEAGAVEIGKERVELNVRLSSAKATLTVNCPDAEADIYINEQKKGHGGWTGQIVDGMYVVEARKAGHRTEKQSLTLAKQEQKTVTLNAPQPIYGKLNLTSTPGNCDVYLDGKKIGKSPDVFANILIGEHSVELRKDGYESQRTKVNIEEGKIADQSLNLQRIGGEVQQSESQKPENKPETKPQQHSGKPSAPKPERQTFIMANAAYNTAPQFSFGLTVGQVKRFGWYVNFMTNFNFTKGDFKCNDNGYPIESSPSSYTLIGESSSSRLNLTAGAVLRCAKPFCLYLGTGYGKRSLLWKTSDGNYATVDAHSYQGLAIDAGAMLHFDGFSLSLGTTSVGFGYWEAKLGIGFNF